MTKTEHWFCRPFLSFTSYHRMCPTHSDALTSSWPRTSMKNHRVPRIFSQPVYPTVTATMSGATSTSASAAAVAVAASASSAALASNPAAHDGTTCSVCGVSPIVGVRFRCTICPNADLCSACEANNAVRFLWVFFFESVYLVIQVRRRHTRIQIDPKVTVLCG
jgi:hypothetical protein